MNDLGAGGDLHQQPDSPGVVSARLWGALEVAAVRFGEAIALFENARTDFVAHQRAHGFVDAENRALSIRSRP